MWEFAGLMVTYWCSAKCAFCYVYSGPDRGGALPIDDAVALWRSLDELASRHGKTMRIHLAGGEPFGDWPQLLGTIRAARDAGLTPLEKVETNASWATDDYLVRARLEQLDALGMEKLIVSADVYHQEFVPFARVKRLVDAARQVLGPGRVRVRWWDYFNDPHFTNRLTPAQRRDAYAHAIEQHRDRLTGRAALRLADYFPKQPAAAFAGDHCVKPVLHSKHVHIDPYGNIFPGTCGGIILGQATATRSVADVWEDLAQNWRAHPVVGPVVTGGSYALMQHAERFGYRERLAGYANKCHLCMDVRQFLVDRNIYPEAVGPAECYANDRDKQDAAQALPVVPLTVGNE